MGRGTMASRIRLILLVLISAYAVFAAASFWVMRQRPERFGAIMRHVPVPAMMLLPFESMWNVARGGALRVGEPAPDFTLPTADKASEMHLSSFRGRLPVVLVFGSYT
jgi:hypothetical protein